ncbi:aldo/keto reductase [Candidatus Dojkabacteria bacterium]|nr:aldo/keto reductase [Candidatus Dojkabacteria bacterium]
MLDPQKISKIGIGTYGIGGRGHRDVELTEKQEDRKYIDAIAYTLKHGANFSEISAGYGHGNSLRLFAKGLKASLVKRENLFLTNSLYPRDLPNIETLKEDLKAFYEILETDYADSTLVTLSLLVKFGHEKVYEMLHEFIDSGKTRFVSISNASPDSIAAFKKEFGDKVFAHEGHISFEVRAMAEKGIFDTCNTLGITNIIWRPLHRNATTQRNWPLLLELSQKYGKTQNQIILNWICHLGFHPMVMSANPKHIDENLSAPDFTMELSDYQRINKFRPQNYNPPKVDWEKTGKGVSIVELVVDFDKHIKL